MGSCAEQIACHDELQEGPLREEGSWRRSRAQVEVQGKKNKINQNKKIPFGPNKNDSGQPKTFNCQWIPKETFAIQNNTKPQTEINVKNI